MTLKELFDQSITECKEISARIDSRYRKGMKTFEEVRTEKERTAYGAWRKIKLFCDDEEIDMDKEIGRDFVYQALFASVGIQLKKVPIRYYPRVELVTGGLCIFSVIEGADILFYNENPIGKEFRFKKTVVMGSEKVIADYYFKVRKEENNQESGGRWEGWKSFSGNGRLEGYEFAGAIINLKEEEGQLQSIVYQKMYPLYSEPIWKRHSAIPVEGYTWIDIDRENPEKINYKEGEFYSDETIDPPRGQHYKEQGILAYDDTEEIVILGIKDRDAEVVEIPCEINGKPVTVIDEECFENCCKALKKVILPDTLKEIGDRAFKFCENLDKPVIPPSVTKIGKRLFG